MSLSHLPALLSACFAACGSTLDKRSASACPYCFWGPCWPRAGAPSPPGSEPPASPTSSAAFTTFSGRRTTRVFRGRGLVLPRRQASDAAVLRRPVVFAIDDSPRSVMGPASRAPAFTTTPPPDPPARSSSSAISGSRSPGWANIPSAGCWPCLCRLCSTSVPRTSSP